MRRTASPRYAQELAADFHVFYKHCRVIGVPPAEASSRLALCLVTRTVIFRCLDLLGRERPGEHVGGRVSPVPELPEVETVRCQLAPA